jgi:hypothetical protein
MRFDLIQLAMTWTGFLISMWAFYRCKRYRDQAADCLTQAFRKEKALYISQAEYDEKMRAALEASFKRGYALGVSETKASMERLDLSSLELRDGNDQ